MAAVLQQVQGGMWLVLGLALGAMLLSVLVRSAAFKGWWGEYKVRRWLAQDLDAQHYHCAHNITLRRQDGTTLLFATCRDIRPTRWRSTRLRCCWSSPIARGCWT